MDGIEEKGSRVTSIHVPFIIIFFLSMGQTASSSQNKSDSPSGCPIQHNYSQCPIDNSINPLNKMPSSISQSPAPLQSSLLSTSRTQSSIPKDHSAKWEYPSPQQFYNALVRKGWVTPEEHIDTMVQIHNFLNEQAWLQVLKWEMRQTGYALLLLKKKIFS